MTPTPQADLSLLAFAIALASTIIGPQLSYFAGAYSLILLGWFGGLMVGLYRRPQDAKMPVPAYVASTFIFSMCATVPASEWIGHHSPLQVEVGALLFPISAAIPAFPDKLARLGQRIVRKWTQETKEKRP